jgi:hypothetical protein
MIKVEVTIPANLEEDFLADRLNRRLQIWVAGYPGLPATLRKMFKEAKIIEQTPRVPCTLDKEGIFEICDDNINAHFYPAAFEKVKILISMWGDDFHKYLRKSLNRCVPDPYDAYEAVCRELGFKNEEIDGKRYFVQRDGKGNIIWKQELTG